MTPFVWALAALATYRLTMLITDDEITADARDWLQRRLRRPAHRPVRVDVVDARGNRRRLRGDPRDRRGGPWVTWLSVRCDCGHVTPGPDDDDLDPREPLAVLSAYNAHRNRHSGEVAHPKLSTLVGCPWCVSVWISVPVVASAVEWGDESWWQLAAGALAAAAVTGIVAYFARP